MKKSNFINCGCDEEQISLWYDLKIIVSVVIMRPLHWKFKLNYLLQPLVRTQWPLRRPCPQCLSETRPSDALNTSFLIVALPRTRRKSDSMDVFISAYTLIHFLDCCWIILNVYKIHLMYTKWSLLLLTMILIVSDDEIKW